MRTALLLIVAAGCAQVDPDTYRTADSYYDRSDGWRLDSSYNLVHVSNGLATGTQFAATTGAIAAGAMGLGDDQALTFGDDSDVVCSWDTTSFTADAFVCALDGADGIAIGHDPVDVHSGSVVMGRDCESAGVNTVAIGDRADCGGSGVCLSGTASSTYGVAILGTTSASSGISIGNLSSATGTTTLAAGYDADATAARSVAIGPSTTVGSAHYNGVAIGASAATTAAQQMQLGSSTYPLNVIAHAGVQPGSYTADPCGSLTVGSFFYNSTANVPCYCGAASADLRVSDDTDCFP